MRIRFLVALALVLGLSLLAWAPWETPSRYANRVERAFARAWEGIVDGCGLDCARCGARPTVRVPFGYLMDLEYACGMMPADLPEYHEQAIVLVTVFGSIHGMPVP